MPNRKPQRLEWAPLILRYAPLTLILLLAVAEAWHLWGPISVQDLPAAFDVTCTGTVTAYKDGRPVGLQQPWQPRYHVDLHRRSVEALTTGKHIHISSVDRKRGSLWLEDDESKAAGRNIVSYFFRQGRVAGSLDLETKTTSEMQIKKATCVQTPTV
jgi:hypothetical protein